MHKKKEKIREEIISYRRRLNHFHMMGISTREAVQYCTLNQSLA